MRLSRFLLVWYMALALMKYPIVLGCRHLDADSVFGVGDAVYDARRDVTVLSMTQYVVKIHFA